MPEDWMREMGCAPAEEKRKNSTDSHDDEGSKNLAKNNVHVRTKPRFDEEIDLPPVSILDSVKSILISVIAAVLAGVAYYYISNRPATLKPPSKGLVASVVVDATILEVYDYMSTPDFRTEWHFNTIEINGPAIDHSAIPGEIIPATHWVLVGWFVIQQS
jgi:hypothetical protein